MRGGRLTSIKDWTERALYGKVLACQKAGDAATGLRTIRYLRAWAPNSPFVLALVPLKLEFEGESLALAESISQAEREAAQWCEQAHAAFWKNHHDEALPLLQQVLSQHPDTTAALRAKVDMARILWGRSRFEESRELFQRILDEIGPVAPDADYARLAQHRIARVDMIKWMKSAQLRARDRDSVAPEQWEEIRKACKVVMELAPDPAERADAHGVLIATYSYERRYEDVLRESKYFFRIHRSTSGAKDSKFPGQVAWVHPYAGDALEHLSRPDEAAEQYRAILQWDTDHPNTLGAEQKVVERAALRLRRVTGQ